MTHHEPRPAATRDAHHIVPALTRAEYLARTANATRPYTADPIGHRRRHGSNVPQLSAE